MEGSRALPVAERSGREARMSNDIAAFTCPPFSLNRGELVFLS